MESSVATFAFHALQSEKKHSLNSCTPMFMVPGAEQRRFAILGPIIIDSKMTCALGFLSVDEKEPQQPVSKSNNNQCLAKSEFSFW
jgi:hypothetical protein